MIASNFEPSQILRMPRFETQSFRSEKVSHHGVLTRDRDLSQFEVEPFQNLMHMPSRDNTSFDDFLAISRTSAYLNYVN